MSVRVGGVVGICMGNAPARAALVQQVVTVPVLAGDFREPRLNLVAVIQIGVSGLTGSIVVTFHDVPHADDPVWSREPERPRVSWKYAGPELYVRGPIALEAKP